MGKIGSHFIALDETLMSFKLEPVRKAAQFIYEAWKNKRRVYTFGNGGSASTAEHFASGLSKELGIKAQALTLNPLITAIANDAEYKYIFAHQLKVLLEPKDVVIGISYSGKSPNVVKALATASRPVLLINRILITGPKKHPYQITSCDVVIHVNTEDIMVAEDLHLAICHSIEKQVGAMIKEHSNLMEQNQPQEN